MVVSLQQQRSGAFSLGQLGNSHILEVAPGDKRRLANLLTSQQKVWQQRSDIPPAKKKDAAELYNAVIKRFSIPEDSRLQLKQYIALDEQEPWLNAHLTFRQDAYGDKPWLNDVFSTPHARNTRFSFSEFSNAIFDYLQYHQRINTLKYATIHPNVRQRYHALWGAPTATGDAASLGTTVAITDTIVLANRPNMTLPPVLSRSHRDIPVDAFISTHRP
jgi:hypothetical protein